jgi:hypothetical protein
MTVIVRLDALGIGNLMFQYAAARKIGILFGVPVKLDCTRTRSTAQIEAVGRATQDQLDQITSNYNLSFDYSSEKEILGICGCPGTIRNIPYIGERLFTFIGGKNSLFKPNQIYEFDNRFLDLRPPVYLNSTYINPRYFSGIENTIMDEFTVTFEMAPEVKELAQRIDTGNAVSVHIRRGDYLEEDKTRNLYPVYGDAYAQEAAKIVEKKHGPAKYFVFSDDIQWAKNNVLVNKDAIYVSQFTEDASVDLELMRRCKHNIICNSTFSWWGAFLNRNPDKTVISPRKWRNDSINVDDMILNGWVAL